MKKHIMIALGLLMAILFSWRGAQALVAPGFGFAELYAAGGLVLAGWLIFLGISDWRAGRH